MFTLLLILLFLLYLPMLATSGKYEGSEPADARQTVHASIRAYFGSG